MCISHVVQLGRLNDQIAASGTSTLAIGPRGQTAAALVARKLEVPFPVLADPARRAYRAYGFTKSLWVIQQSGWVAVDRDGIVQHVCRNTNPQNSFDEDEVLRAVRSVGS